MLVLPLPIYSIGDVLWLDTQACNGLRLWLKNFDTVAVCCPVIAASEPPAMTSPVSELLPTDKLSIHCLPAAWTPPAFLRHLLRTARELKNLIDKSTHLQFAIGGFWGDWGAIAALLAAKRGRKAAIWTDRVESQVMAFQAQQSRGLRRLYRRINAVLAKRLERHVIRRSAMGLFHGMDTYNAYVRYSRDGHLVHDIHLGAESRIAPHNLTAKIARPSGRKIEIIYGGRVHPDKGPTDWIETLAALKRSGADFHATWFGDGPDLAASREMIARLGVGDRIFFPGPTQDREALMQAFRDADIFLFCHKTLESPRCLVEALLSGTPIVGYDSPYPRDLIGHHGGGVMTAANPTALAEAIAALIAEPDALARLTEAAAKDGHPMIDEEVFRHRSDLIKSL
ncbi:glycosyltransferase [Sphingomonas sp. Leaf357]|uniref:glycosyltransferase n=1 Tax=Sphingomonas sp. Leaf357 TaxID=1736350 RepID=UPI001F440B30|nr:glycosyltransferase [Sphingomonas sp. Leaf357]